MQNEGNYFTVCAYQQFSLRPVAGKSTVIIHQNTKPANNSDVAFFKSLKWDFAHIHNITYNDGPYSPSS